MENVSTRSHCDLVLKINKLIQNFDEKTHRDPGHGVRIHLTNHCKLINDCENKYLFKLFRQILDNSGETRPNLFRKQNFFTQSDDFVSIPMFNK